MTTTSTAATTLRIGLGCGPVLQVSVDKSIELAVEHAVYVRGLLAGAMVLYQFVRVKYVGADLRPPLDLGLLTALRGDLLFPLLAFELEEPRPQDPHGHLTVLMLAALVLALGDDARGEVRDPYRRVGLVDVLAAGPRGPVGVHLEVLFVDLDLDGLAQDGRDGDGGEAGVPPRTGVEGADPDETMYPALGFMVSIASPSSYSPAKSLATSCSSSTRSPRSSSSSTSGSRSPSSSASSSSSPESERRSRKPSRSSILPCTREKRADTALASSGSSQKLGRLMSSPSSSASLRSPSTSKNASSSARRPCSSEVLSFSSVNDPPRLRTRAAARPAVRDTSCISCRCHTDRDRCVRSCARSCAGSWDAGSVLHLRRCRRAAASPPRAARCSLRDRYR